MTYVNALKKIFSFPRTAGAPTLERMRLLCKYLGEPQKKLKFVHIAGTNGKGSCAAMLDSVLRDGGYKVGRYISPYILDFRERMTFCGEMISHAELCEHTKTVLEAVSRLQNDVERARNGEETTYPIPSAMIDGTISALPVQFEVVSAIGFLFFLYKRCDVVLLECGLGGRFDATNVIEPPLAAVIMGIGLDHTELLGDTVEKIAAEKCGIIKKGTQEIISYPQQPSVMAVISAACVKANARISVPLKTELKMVQASLGGLGFSYKGKNYFSKLSAYYQLFNAGTVIEVCEALRRVGMEISQSNIENGLAKTFFPGRFEVLGVSPAFIVDGAHNEHGIKAFCESVEMISDSIAGETVFALGMLRDKKPEETLMPFAELATVDKIRTKRIITLTPDSPRAMPADELAALLSELTGGKIEVIPITESGKARKKALFGLLGEIAPSDAVISFGSLYLASEMRLILKEFLENYRPEM